jgi:hypothetical protein
VAVPYDVVTASVDPTDSVGRLLTFSSVAAALPIIPATDRLTMCTSTAAIGSARGATASNA